MECYGRIVKHEVYFDYLLLWTRGESNSRYLTASQELYHLTTGPSIAKYTREITVSYTLHLIPDMFLLKPLGQLALKFLHSIL